MYNSYRKLIAFLVEMLAFEGNYNASTLPRNLKVPSN